ncbi:MULTISPECIES: DUF2249 domain-containing protein [Halorubrum]|jgi:uncharacterized protein (DUF2249 family)|uniref:DUF2249 domain-containing protein n=4 Tax=Halorubrum TaxID=56688 RepID=A0A2A2F6S0_9EURY|nr:MULTISPECIES: DUF2249 domain-containing protein [Halorubrum]MBP1902961.1 uncharacterized protein (DUF2249 family) [Halorubrum trapanicum]PAU80292.1 hypothetical protein CK500_15640 [Halorubrum salipaludis]
MATERNEIDRRLDVREIDGEPFGDIMAELEALSDDETLLLINSFEPEPLYQVLEERGFQYETMSDGSDVWYIEIRHE